MTDQSNPETSSQIERVEEKLDEKESEVQRLKNELSEKEARLEEAEADIAEQEHEVQQIATIQTELLPQQPPKLPNFKLAASYVAPGKAGGDYYDFLPMRVNGETQSLTMIVADASGHGPAAAVIMAMMHSLLHAFADDHTDPDEIMSDMNRELCGKELSNAMVTALLLDLEPIQRRLRYACAGHHPPLIRRADGRVEELACPSSGLPLSVDIDTDYAMDEVVIELGETLLVFTDGAIEIEDAEGREFGLDRLIDAIQEAPPSARGLIRFVNGRIAKHRKEQLDDKTLLAIQCC